MSVPGYLRLAQQDYTGPSNPASAKENVSHRRPTNRGILREPGLHGSTSKKHSRAVALRHSFLVDKEAEKTAVTYGAATIAAFGPPLPEDCADGREHVSYGEVVSWLLDAADSVLLSALAPVAEGRPELVQHALDRAQIVISDASRWSLTTSLPRRSRSRQSIEKDSETFPHSYLPTVPVVQFTAPTFFCMEDCGEAVLEVARIGGDSSRLRSQVGFETLDDSAKSGRTYTSTSGTLVFEPGEVEKEIRVPIFQNERWDPTLEFKVRLLNEATNADVQHHLHTCQVKVIDNDCFPTDKYRNEIRMGSVKTVHASALLWEYFKFNFQNPKVRDRTLKILLIDTLHILYKFALLFVRVYLVDFVLNPRRSVDELLFVRSKELSLLLLVVITIVPFGLLHMIDYLKVSRCGVAGATRLRLQVALCRKILNYDLHAQAEVSHGEVIQSLTRDSVNLADQGYQNVLNLAKEYGSLMLMLLYQCLAPHIFDKKFSVYTFAPLFILPALMISFFSVRQQMSDSVLMEQHVSQCGMVEKVEEIVRNQHLIAAYSRRPAFVAQFEGAIRRFNASSTAAATVLGNNLYFALWLLEALLAFWMLWGGSEVIAGHASLGMFLANLNIFKQVGHSWIGIYDTFLEIHSVLPALERMILLMNLPTDVRARKEIADLRRAITKDMRRNLQTVIWQDDCAVQAEHVIDQLPLAVGNISFTYITKVWDLEGVCEHHKKVVNLTGMMEAMQGEVCCLIGPKGGGKSTLLQILSGEIVPSLGNLGMRSSVHSVDWSFADLGSSGEGRLFIPSHLRVVAVRDPMFIEGSLMDNLTFGSLHERDSQPKRVWKICKKIGVSDDILNCLNTGDVQHWTQVLSQTQRQLLSIARALVSSPEVLCLHRPCTVFSQETTMHVHEALQDFVRSRGFEQDQLCFNSRRPRTCIMTAHRLQDVEGADRLFHVSEEHGIRALDEELATRKEFMHRTRSTFGFNEDSK